MRLPSGRDGQRSVADVVDLLRGGCWSSLPIETVASLIDGGTVVEFVAGQSVYEEADTERLAVVVRGLLRVYMHASDGRQVTVRYVRPGEFDSSIASAFAVSGS